MISYGFSTLGCPNYSVDEVIAIATVNGFSGVEIRFIRGTVDLASLPEFLPSGITETRRKFEDAGIAVVGVGTSLRMVSLDPGERAKQIDAAAANTEIAAGLGAKYLRVFGGPLPPQQDKDRTLDAIATGLGAIGDLSAKSGVTSLLETHDDFSRSANQQALLRAILDQVRSREGEPGFLESGAVAAFQGLETDLATTEIYRFAHAVARIDPAQVDTSVVGGRPFTTSGGGSVVIPDRGQARALARDARDDAQLDGGCR